MISPLPKKVKPHKLDYETCVNLVKDEIRKDNWKAQNPPPPDLHSIQSESWNFITYATTYLFYDGKFNQKSFNESLTEGYDDQLLDIVTTSFEAGELDICCVQCKSQKHFSDADLQRIDGGLRYLFHEDPKEFKKLKNKRLISCIKKVRKLVEKAKVINVNVLYVTLGQTGEKQVPDQIIREKKRLERQWSKSSDFDKFTVTLLGAQDLHAYQVVARFTPPKFAITLNFYRPNTQKSQLEYISPQSKKRAIVFSATLANFAKVIKQHQEWIFQENLRVFRELKNPVNYRVFESARGKQAEYFWLLNNGVTITCKKFRTIPHKPKIRLDAPQIVNGCQTSMTLLKALSSGKLQGNAHLLVRAIEVHDNVLAEDIALATNSQTPIVQRDLRSNDLLQKSLTIGFTTLGRFYETKKGQYRKEKRNLIIPNDRCGQASLAVLFKKPAVALSNKAAIWEDEWYGKIFRKTHHQLLYAYELRTYCDKRRKTLIHRRKLEQSKVKSNLEESITSYAYLHLARIISHYLLGYNVNQREKIEKATKQICHAAPQMGRHYKKARAALKTVLREQQKKLKVFNYFNLLKKAEIDSAIDKYLSGH